MNIKNYLSGIAEKNGLVPGSLQLPDCELEPENIKVIMISEVPPKDPADGFYSADPESAYMKSRICEIIS